VNIADQTSRRQRNINYFYYIESTKQDVDYRLTAEQIIIHVKKEYESGNDIAKAIWTEESPDMKT
jgi:hypothetical protein